MTHYNHEYSRPIEVQGGIRAASRRGEFGSNWWAKRWMQTLEQFRIGARLSRGRCYARRGQVLSIDIQNGVVEAQVQGSRKRPYDVEISVRTIDSGDWERLRQPAPTSSGSDGASGGENRAPAFLLPVCAMRVPENSLGGVKVGPPVTATDPDGDALTYIALDGADYDSETKSSYRFMVIGEEPDAELRRQRAYHAVRRREQPRRNQRGYAGYGHRPHHLLAVGC